MSYYTIKSAFFQESPCSEERVGENRGLILFILNIPAQDVFLLISADANTMCNTFYEFNDFSICSEAAGLVDIKAQRLRIKEIARKKSLFVSK